ncbi:orotidine-5'-phosphate decarboxylase [Rhodothalassium salexigens DSM 2132]|uniref:Orotidine 5'-phosphate decarboxylase n=1 Tax=Rhodothalassium salexigens DSM 2132 TaxID=1188247 RepID=A0A4R2PIQ4_RHOSA|nr:orotidine-5'-phosphate decarboxylase [Rhodothalassium salexigens]MBB4211590.1 orotidine-5'-phosphate decarboxylase [Rhodothalassium salexigens DSM 2132]TCP34478.1 orotidine-5'-phosphate decarboxylase [Rhodothalassium salexigens DSM 2132]
MTAMRRDVTGRVGGPDRRPQLFCALDTPDGDRAVALARQVAGQVDGLKVGLELFCAAGPAALDRLSATGLPLFLDLKLHDIPNTVAGAVRSLMSRTPALMTLHAQGGAAMMTAAVEAAGAEAARLGVAPPVLLGVTVLTSLDRDDLAAVGVADAPADQVLRLARLGRASGLGGLVCSSREVAAVRAAVGPDMTLVVPGIRPAGAAIGDQKRVMTPAQAVAAGADLLVVGRPITQADDPAAAAAAVADEIRTAWEAGQGAASAGRP